MKWFGIIAEFFAALIKALLGERSRDEAQQSSGELAAEHEIVSAANERGKNAKQISDIVSRDSDNQLDERMRRNREIYASSKAGRATSGNDDKAK